MKGSMRERKPGVYELNYDADRDLNGKRYRRSETFRGSEAEARVRLAQLVAEAERQRTTLARLGQGSILIRDWLKIFMDDVVRPTCKISTQERYQSAIDLHLEPRVGHIRLGQLSPEHVRRLQQELLDEGLSG